MRDFERWVRSRSTGTKTLCCLVGGFLLAFWSLQLAIAPAHMLPFAVLMWIVAAVTVAIGTTR